MGQICCCRPRTASSHSSGISCYLTPIYSHTLSVASPSQLGRAAAVCLKMVMFSLRAMGRIRGWVGSCRRSGGNRKQPRLPFHLACCGCSAGARSPPALPARCQLLSLTPTPRGSREGWGVAAPAQQGQPAW